MVRRAVRCGECGAWLGLEEGRAAGCGLRRRCEAAAAALDRLVRRHAREVDVPSWFHARIGAALAVASQGD